MSYITRIAPSPTGMMHFGTGRTAYFNWLAAKSTNGKFILRMDDTDAERNKPEVEQPIYDGLKWLGLEWDKFYRQSERADVYSHYAKILQKAGLIVPLENGALALRIDPNNPPTWVPGSWYDEVSRDVNISHDDLTRQINNLIIMRGGDKLGQATYQFASIVDDYDLNVNFIIRGIDHITNTSKQVVIWHALNHAIGKDKPAPKFAHVGLIYKGGKKLSKRDGAASLLSYRDNGYNPDAVLNFMLRLGWGPTVDDKSTAMLNKEDAIRMFLNNGGMKNVNASFDQAKLDSFDRKYKALIIKAQRNSNP